MTIWNKLWQPLCLLIILQSIPVTSQNFPDYPERGVFQLPDSLLSLNKRMIVTEGTEGPLDPEKYYIGPGDEIIVSISGVEEMVYNLVVDYESRLYIPKLGGIDLNGATLKEAKEKISNAILNFFKDVDIYISLSGFRKIKVSLIGDVKNPSSYILTANSRLLDLIVSSSGLTATSNYRNIRVTSAGNISKEYDLLSFLRNGDQDQNPYLKEGDVVFVDKIDQTVKISGEIKFPAAYEFKAGESVVNLIKLAGGFLSKARKDSIELVSFDEKGRMQFSRYFSFQELEDAQIQLSPFDQVLVRQIPDYLIERYVKVEGYVMFPGWYKIEEDKTYLSEIIEEAGGFHRDASVKDATLFRHQENQVPDPEFERLKLIPRADMTEDEYDYFKAKSRQQTGKVVVDFEKLFIYNDKSEDVLLKRGDIINVPEAKNYVILLGQVVNPGNVIYNENYTVQDYIRLAGGFGWRALEDEVRVIKSISGEWLEEDDVEKIDPGDTIWIPEDPPGPKFWDVFTTSLAILGQVASIIAATVAIVVASR